MAAKPGAFRLVANRAPTWHTGTVVLPVVLLLGVGLLALLGFALRLVWLRTHPHFASAADLGMWMKAHDVERVVIRNGQLTVAERAAPVPEVPADARADESTKHIDDEINEALGVFAREQKRGHA